MENLKNKTAAIAIALLLTLSVCGPLIALLPTAGAHSPPWIFTPVAYTTVAPNPCGTGQQVLIYGWVNQEMPGNLINNTIRYQNYQFIVTAPDGTSQTFNFPYVSDSAESQYFAFVPNQVGTYNITFLVPQQIYNFPASQMTPTGAQTPYQGDIFEPCNASTTLTVQSQAASVLPGNPIPSSFWSRPMFENQNQMNFVQLGSNWLGGSYNQYYTQFNGLAPTTAHIMWTKPMEYGGLGGASVTQPQLPPDPNVGQFYTGNSYNTRFGNPLIVQGVLYYQEPIALSGTGGPEVAVNLQTGQTLWTSTTFYPTRAQILDYIIPDQFGYEGALLWVVSGSTWAGYNAFTLTNVYNLTNVPSGTEVTLNNGEIDRYVFSYNQTSKSGWLALWNQTAALNQLLSTQVFDFNSLPSGNPAISINANTPASYSWNVTINSNLNGQFGVQPSIVGIIPGDVILGDSSSIALASQPNPNTNPWTMWALNDNLTRGTEGQLLWLQNYVAPPNNETEMLSTQPLDPFTNEWTMTIADTSQRLAFDLMTGKQLWGPLGTQPGFQYYSSREGVPAYGNLYTSGYGGVVTCYSMKTGQLLWTYGNGGPGNSTNMGANGPWGLYPTHLCGFADGMIFTMSGEHSPNTPLYNGELARALNATTGQEMWTLLDWSSSGLGTAMANIALADGYYVFDNAYDNQVYCLGQGPSQTTVNAPDTAATVGTPVVIRGSVIDISNGTKQLQQSTNFPNGVPCVSDASESQWMEYVYQDQPMTTHVTGVPVSLYVIDSNNNYRQIGQTTTDSSGFFTYSWAPDIPGNYTVIANFAGSNSYYGSSSESSFYATAEHATAAPTATPISLATTQNYIIGIGIAIIVVIIIIGAVLAMLLLRKRP